MASSDLSSCVTPENSRVEVDQILLHNWLFSHHFVVLIHIWKCNNQLFHFSSDVTMMMSPSALHWIIKVCNYSNFYMLLCGNNALNKWLFCHSWTTMYMYSYTMQKNICFATLSCIIILNYAKLRNDLHAALLHFVTKIFLRYYFWFSCQFYWQLVDGDGGGGGGSVVATTAAAAITTDQVLIFVYCINRQMVNYRLSIKQ
jgi:hypothetical protein